MVILVLMSSESTRQQRHEETKEHDGRAKFNTLCVFASSWPPLLRQAQDDIPFERLNILCHPELVEWATIVDLN